MTRPSRIGVNLLWLVPGVVGGSEEATLAALRAAGDEVAAAGLELVVFALPALLEVAPDLADRFEVATVDLSGTNKVMRVLAENTALRRAASSRSIQLMHHGGGVIPPGVPIGATLAIHDTQPLDLPQNFGVVKRRYLGTMIGRSTHSARLVTVPSEFVRQRLIEHTHVDARKVVVVPWTVPPAPTVGGDAIDEVRLRYGLDRPYVLYPAIAYDHKNHAVLLDAFARLVGGATPGGSTDVDLVLTGGPGPLDDEIAARSAQTDLAGRVHRPGRIPRSALETVLAGAAAVAVPSRYEGFGLPAIEALASGRPTVVANAGSLPEIVEDGALIIDPDDVAGWAAALEAVLSDADLRARLVVDGPAVAASFTPHRTAAGLIDVWTRALADVSTPRTNQ